MEEYGNAPFTEGERDDIVRVVVQLTRRASTVEWTGPETVELRERLRLLSDDGLLNALDLAKARLAHRRA